MIEETRAEPERREDESRPAPVAPRIAATPAAAAVRCPYCHGELAKDLLVARCEICRTPHHTACFGESGACSVHGCRGRAAHVSTQSQRGPRQTFRACTACQAAIFLDERAALCRGCDSAHHPHCLEGRGSCAKCGSRDATLMAAMEFHRASAEVKEAYARSASPAVKMGIVLLVASVIALAWGNLPIAAVLVICSLAELLLGVIVYSRSVRVATLVAPPPSDAGRQ